MYVVYQMLAYIQLTFVLQDSKSEIRNLAKFLEVEVDENLVRDIDDLCSFDKMKGDKNKHEDPTGWKNKQPGMYRKGKQK